LSAAKVYDFAAAFAIIGGAHDPLRAVWDDRAGRDDRRLLLAMAGTSAFDAQHWGKKNWCDLPGPVRSDIATGLRRFKGWAEKVGA
jgi:hypothetical protein